MTDKKRSFVMYTDYLEYFEMLDTEGKAEMIMLILRYADGCKVDVDAMPIHIKAIFTVIRKRIDEDTAKYLAACAAKQKAAKAREQKKRAALTGKSTAVTDNENENEYDNEYENENVSVSESVVVVVNDNSACAKEDNSAACAATTTAETTTTTHTEKKNNSDDPSFKAPDYKEVYEFCRLNNLPIDPAKFINYYCANGWKIGKNPMRDWESAVRVWAANEYKHGSKNNKNTPAAPPSALSAPSFDVSEMERRDYAKYADL